MMMMSTKKSGAESDEDDGDDDQEQILSLLAINDRECFFLHCRRRRGSFIVVYVRQARPPAL